MTPSKRAAPLHKRITPRVKVWLEIDGRYVFGFGISEILKSVHSAGSIKEGARRMGKSYRYAWGRIKKAEEALGIRLVETRVGGRGTDRSALTQRAQQLVAQFDALRAKSFALVAHEFSAQPAPR